MSRQLVAALTVLALALAGFGVWALVCGYLVSQMIGTIAILVLTRFRLKPSFVFRGIADELRFGANMVGKSLVSLFNRRIDVVLIGRFLGAEPLGAFSVANDLARLPMRLLLRPVTTVAFPTISRLREESTERVRQLYILMISASLLVLVPLCWGASVVAEPLVGTVLGEKWLLAAPILAVLGIVIPLRAAFRLTQSTLDGLGRPDIGLRNLLTLAICLPPALVIGAMTGDLLGVAIGWAAAQLVAFFVNLRRSLPVIGVIPGTLARDAAPALIAGAIMVLGVVAIDAGFAVNLSELYRLLVLTAAGGLLYLLVSLIINRRLMIELVQLFLRPAPA